jgi:hypothetical protein
MVLCVAMRRGLIVAVAVAVSLVCGSSAASGGPVLRFAAPLGGHVVVTVAVAELAPGRVEVATSARTEPSGGFRAGTVKIRETITVQPSAAGIVRWQTRKALPRGTYYVAVSGFRTGGVTSCMPLRGNCLELWSNVRRVVLR